MNLEEEKKEYTKEEIALDLRSVVNVLADLNELYDLTSVIAAIKSGLAEFCRALRVKHFECEILPDKPDDEDFSGSLSGLLDINKVVNPGFVLYEAEGPEFESLSYECSTPKGEIVRCSISLMDLYPEEIHVIKAKWLCEQVCLYISRARIGTEYVDMLNKDSDTGLPNMQAFFAFGEKLFNDFRIADYCVVALNISNFKFVNQTVPFEVGTAVIIKYAHKLFSLTGPEEIVTRFGGDNFNILIKKENLPLFLERVKLVPIDIKDGNLRVHFELSCYAGIYDIQTRTAIQAAVENALNAKTVAKNTPHNSFVYYTDDMGERQHYKNQVRASFTRAIDKNEFVAYYQPKVNIDTQEIIGMEALVRWENDGEVLRPSRFVTILEDTSSIIELDRCMLRQVCRDIKRWESMELKVPRISVNLSRRNLNNDSVADDIAAVLDEYHVDHSNVEIEVTETVDNAEFNNLAEFILRMKAHGIKVSIDDFGTGYSSLNLLKSLNADVLKIDRSFIDLDVFTEKDELLIKNIITIAKTYNMEVITEGVETEEQIRFLKKCGCENVQGYFFDMPLSKMDVTNRLKKGKYNKKYKL